MAVVIRKSSDSREAGVKAMVYGPAGIGKTCLMASSPRPLILSCESGLLSVADADVPYIRITSMKELEEAFEYVTSPEGLEQYNTLCLDSVTDIAEVYLTHLKETSRDPRAAYGDLATDFGKLIRGFRDIQGKNVLFSAKEAYVKDDASGVTIRYPMMPGKSLTQGLAFFFDEVFHMDIMLDDQGAEHRVLKTSKGIGYEAKDRSGNLARIERPNMTHILNKIRGTVAATPAVAATQTESN